MTPPADQTCVVPQPRTARRSHGRPATELVPRGVSGYGMSIVLWTTTTLVGSLTGKAGETGSNDPSRRLLAGHTGQDHYARRDLGGMKGGKTRSVSASARDDGHSHKQARQMVNSMMGRIAV